MTDEFQSDIARRTRTACLLGIIVFVYSSIAYYAMGCVVGMNARYDKDFFHTYDDRWTVTECVYAAAITVTTVGYGDVLGTNLLVVYRDKNGRFRYESPTDPHQHPEYDAGSEELWFDWSPYTRFLTSTQVIVGMAFFLYVVAQLTSFFVDGGYDELVRRWRAQRKMARLSDHIIVLGAGESARYAVERVVEEGIACAVLDVDRRAVDRLHCAFPMVPCLQADASAEQSLVVAGIKRARGLISTMPDDPMNLVAVVTARQVHSTIRIVGRSTKPASAKRLRMAGAAATVSTDMLTGLRIGSELIRPSVAEFLDVLMGRGTPTDIHLDGYPVGPEADGFPIAALGIRERSGLELVAVRKAESDSFVYNPHRGLRVHEGDELAVIGRRATLDKLPEILRTPDRAAQAAEDMSTTNFGATMVVGPVAIPRKPSTAADALSNHYVVCGAGQVGIEVIRELHRTGRRLVVIELRHERIAALQRRFPDITLIEDDADDPDVLDRAGVGKARGLATTFASDRRNLVVGVTALQARPTLRVISLLSSADEADRMRRARLRLVSAGLIGGIRMATEMLRPAITGFLNRMLASPGSARFEGVVVGERAPMTGKSLRDARLFELTGLRVIAVRRATETDFIPHPSADEVLKPGTLLVVVGTSAEVGLLADQVGDWE